ncbi:putative glucose-6-phosphate isomerase [Fragilariopsis cylindrus CCMP1102]|uniref:Glucose-6-phosphate isomerase n=1 Tax=Fragilariopsis cylindrus CCMP1102 TaxID=635003 RepID=A0A1E7FU26_9STRA|nr:putative glucose-6-phosphate isomerase [Fragilariopsis cylindrus CCMP1102]|eukprot:OEU21659.1 putative glucose-6-phosphate isomerase [Fragilariopsis cylindrus CCMP1102]
MTHRYGQSNNSLDNGNNHMHRGGGNENGENGRNTNANGSYGNNSSSSCYDQSYFYKLQEVPQWDALHNAAAEFHCDEKLHLRHLCNDTARCSGLTAVHVSTWASSSSSLLSGGTGGGTGTNGGGVCKDCTNISSSSSAQQLGLMASSSYDDGTILNINDDTGDDISPHQQEVYYNNNQNQNQNNNSNSSLDIIDEIVPNDQNKQLLQSRPFDRSKIVLDYSRQQVTGETMELLFDLADAVQFTERREAFRNGEHVNVTENKPVLHHLLRMPKGYDYHKIALSPSTSSSLSPGTVRDMSMGSQSSFSSFSSNGGGGKTLPTTMPSAGQYASRNSTTAIPPPVDDALQAIHDVRDQIETFSHQIRSGEQHSRGVTNKRITDTIVVSSSGGMHIGTEFIHKALSADSRASQAAEGRNLHFLSNVDPVDTFLETCDLDPECTLVVVVSKDFSTSIELSNFRSIRQWLNSKLCTAIIDENNNNNNIDGTSTTSATTAPPTINRTRRRGESEISERHIVAVTCVDSTQSLGIPETNIFRIWDWIIGRFSVTSAVGILPLSLQYSYEIVTEVLNGAHDMDEHFFNAPLRDNIPVLLGLLGVWNSTFMGYTTRALIPYSVALSKLSPYVSLVDMESNGKRVAIDGSELIHPAGEINLGEPGGNTNHPFFQLMHQGRVIPADFIGFMESPRPLEPLPGEAVSNHDELMSYFFGQPDALAYGKELMDLVQEGVPPGLREHMVFSGNRPSSSILLTRLDPFSIGQLVALYEHRTAVQGFLWGINSFDQFGIELGRTMSSKIRYQLAASRRTGATVQGFNQSTSSLLEIYLAHGKQNA